MPRTKAQRKQLRKQRRIENRAARSSDSTRSQQTVAPETPERADVDLSFRAAGLAESTINEDQRTIVATLTTEQPVAMFDRVNYRGMVDEVLVARGGTFPDQLVMLDDHNRWGGSRSVIGSARGIELNGDRWRGTLHFAREAGEHVDNVWQLVKQRHLTDVSIGYRYGEGDYVDIPASRSQVIDGKTYTAGQRTLRVVTKWTAREVSTTPIGADDQAKIGRNQNLGGTQEATQLNFESQSNQQPAQGQSPVLSSGTRQMNKLLQWLQSRGMSDSITDQSAALDWARRNLAGDLLGEFSTLCRSEEIEFDPQFTPAGNPSSPTTPPVTGHTVTPNDSGRQSSTQTADEIRAEQERVRYIHQVADGVNSGVVQRAIAEGWDTRRINQEFNSEQNRQERSEPLTPAIHTRSSGLNLRTLQAVMLMRDGIEIDNPMLRTQEANHVFTDRNVFGGQRSDWITQHARQLHRGGQTADDASARAIEDAWQYRRMSMVDLCRAALEVEGVRFSGYDRDEIVQRSFSTATLNAIFTTNFAARLLAGFTAAMDTTMGWTSNAQLPNFQTVERIQKHLNSKLKRTDRNITPPDSEAEAVLESYKLHRYTSRFTVDEMDIIDDRFGAIDNTPNDMGQAARQVRPDLVYYILLSNPTMGQDSTALFHADHGNLTASGAGLSFANIEARDAAMASQTSNGILCDIRGDYLIVPRTKKWVARRLVGSSERRDTTSGTEYGTANPIAGEFQVVSEPRLDVGVTDPVSGSTEAGQAGSWFMAAAAGRYGIEVGTLQGTGGAPVIRRYTLQEGRIGMGWLVIHYTGAKAVGYQGLAKSAA